MNGWTSTNLGQVVTLNYGWSLPKRVRVLGTVPVYGSNGIVGSHNKASVPKPGLIVGRKGSAGNVHFSAVPFCPIDTTFFVTQDDTDIDILFLYYLLLHIDLKRILGDVGVPGLNREMAYKEQVIYPEDIFEQRKIAAVLNLVQQAIEQQERLIDLVTELKKTLMHKLFTEGLKGERLKETEMGLVPVSWKVLAFEEFTTLQRGKDLTKDQFIDGIVPVAGSNGIIGYHNEANVKGPGVTVGRSGSVGRVTFYQDDFWAHNTALYVKNYHGNDVKFASYLLEHLNLGRFKSGASVPTLDRNSFCKMQIAVPSVDEQREISKVITAIEEKVTYCNRKKELFNQLFRTLLHQLMTAQIRVNDLDLSGLEEQLEE